MRFLSYIIGLALCAYGVFRGAMLVREVGPDALLPMAISSAELPLALLLFVTGLLFFIAPRGGDTGRDDADPRIPAMRQDLEGVKAKIARLGQAAPDPDARPELEALRRDIAAQAARLDDLADQIAAPEPAQAARPDNLPDLLVAPEPAPAPAPAFPAGGEGLTRPLTEYERLLLDAMIVMIGVDGALEEAEIERTCEAFNAVAGNMVEPTKVRALARMMADDDDSLDNLMSRIATGLDADQRRGIIEGAYVVSVADGELHDDEMAAMHRLGAAMGLGMDEIHRIIDACIEKY